MIALGVGLRALGKGEGSIKLCPGYRCTARYRLSGREAIRSEMETHTPPDWSVYPCDPRDPGW